MAGEMWSTYVRLPGHENDDTLSPSSTESKFSATLWGTMDVTTKNDVLVNLEWGFHCNNYFFQLLERSR
jgi:hypothetical protein